MASMLFARDWRANRLGIGGVANFGRTPTTGIRDPLLETFIFDFEGDIYGQHLEVALVRFLRPELKFDVLDDMVTQMHKDVERPHSIIWRDDSGCEPC